MGVPIAGVELWIIEKDKEPVAKEPVYWNDVSLPQLDIPYAAGPAYYVLHPQKGITIWIFFLTYQAFKNREGSVYQTNLVE